MIEDSLSSRKKTVTIAGLHCNSCIEKTSIALKCVSGVANVRVSLKDQRATLELSKEVDNHDLDKALRAAGDYRIAATHTAPDSTHSDSHGESLYPLLLVVGYLLCVVCVVAWVNQDWAVRTLMRHFMGGFFLVFSFFKLLDLRGFVDAYRGYDLLAKAMPIWAWTYPFVELSLGIAYLAAFALIATNIVTLVLMLVGAVGVLRVLMARKTIRCACLGTALNLPMTKVTLIEDLSMAAMAGAMLL